MLWPSVLEKARKKSTTINQKNPRAHKKKIGTSLPPPKTQNPPPTKRGILPAWRRFSCRKNAIFPGARKIGASISGPRIADKNFTDTRISLNQHFGFGDCRVGWGSSTRRGGDRKVRFLSRSFASLGFEWRELGIPWPWCDWEALSRPISQIHILVRLLNRLVLNHLEEAQPRDYGAIASKIGCCFAPPSRQ